MPRHKDRKDKLLQVTWWSDLTHRCGTAIALSACFFIFCDATICNSSFSIFSDISGVYERNSLQELTLEQLHVLGFTIFFLRNRELATVSNSFATFAARLAGAGLGSWKAGQERQTGLATTALRVHHTQSHAGRHAGAQGIDERAADEQAVDF